MKDALRLLKDKKLRHKERYTSLGYQYVIADNINFLNKDDWSELTKNKTVFMSLAYLQVLDAHSPKNTEQRYALAYQDGKPIAAFVFQLAVISGEQLVWVRLFFNDPKALKYQLVTDFH
ncbi:hypothetical protein [Zooshikella ganghwensis]|uniref:Uncharacterized protein n=1 Tax=Zooshikella ganghwensis TaxID=202772 RepID=A0A4P9VKX3_9GAMM|nr:hypothetical protein [Zooshikella ganghwensis]RDH43426.1 hypothetical protein B9G39_08220 [Zooshikella ganghwensis]